MSQLIIDARFAGPDETANGGYVCGLLAREAGQNVEVTLWKRTPMGKPLSVVTLDDGAVELRDGDVLLAGAKVSSLEMPVPEAVSFEEAERAASAFDGFGRHPFPRCFSCGTLRDDGLRIFPGLIAEREIVAATWVPAADLTDDGFVRPEFVWTALDCPGSWVLAPVADLDHPLILGRLAAALVTPVKAGERCVVTGWTLGEESRKKQAGSALFGEDGGLRAYARATWFRL